MLENGKNQNSENLEVSNKSNKDEKEHSSKNVKKNRNSKSLKESFLTHLNNHRNKHNPNRIKAGRRNQNLSGQNGSKKKLQKYRVLKKKYKRKVQVLRKLPNLIRMRKKN